MSEDSQRAERQRVIEEKRRKLEKLKRERAEKEKAAAEAAEAAGRRPESVDSLVDSILGSRRTAYEVGAQHPSRLKENSGSSEEGARSNGLTKTVNLSVVMKVCHIDMPPRPVESYEKESQTEVSESDFGGVDEDAIPDDSALSPSRQGQVAASHRRIRLSSESAHEQGNHHHRLPGSSPRASLNSTTGTCGMDGVSDEPSMNVGGSSNSPTGIKKMTAEEEEAWENGGREAVLNSNRFSEFVTSSSRLLERAMSQASSFDILMNVTSSSQEEVKRHSDMLTDLSLFECDYLKGRPVLDIQSSPHVESHQDVFLVAYGSVDQASLGPDGKPLMPKQGNSGTNDAAGLVCLWHSAVTASPEKMLTAPSPVLASRFHADDQNLVLGSCYNGQILLWDLRMNSSMPIQRSNLAGKGHKHPVYSMTMSSTAASSELITVSTDGHLCHWDIQRLTDPVSSVILQVPLSTQVDMSKGTTAAVANNSIFNTLSVTSAVLGHSETQKEAILGSENGSLYRISLPYRSTDTVTQINAHQGLVSAMHRNPHGGKFCKDLLLTSSLDWTVKLWNTIPSLFTNEPLLEVVAPSYDYVCDVQWSPVNPALFSTITSGGVLTLWDLSKSTLEAQDSFNILKGLPSSSSGNVNSGVDCHSCALNKLVWSMDGLSLYVGDTRGGVRHIAVKESAARSRPGDEGRMQINLNARKAVEESNHVQSNNNDVGLDDV